MKIKLLSNIILLIITFLFITPTILRSQEKGRLIGFGFNLPPLIGRTISLETDFTKNRFYCFTIGIGGMSNNKLQGTFNKIGQATFNHINSGVSSSFGIRYTHRKELNKSYFFAGTKLLFGYFKQSANYHEPLEDWFRNKKIPDDYYFRNDRIYSEGLFTAFAFEIGGNLKITKLIHSEIGLQGGSHFFTTKWQLSQWSSILPGLGAMNFVGILKIKYVLGK